MERANLLFRFGRSLRGIKDLGCPIAVVPRQFGQQWFLTCGGLATRQALLFMPPDWSACTLCYHVGMKPQAASVQYTIRGVPPEVDRVLRQKAARRKQSLNRVILEELTEAAIGGRRRADFSDLAGQWTPDPAFDEILAAQRQIDRDKWK
jgi:hypothetical protein